MPTEIYTNIINQINMILASVTQIKQIIASPSTKLTKYPGAIFFPANWQNDPETNKENLKFYRFKLWVVVGVNQTNINQVFTSTLPKAVDAVLAAFDSGWSLTSINSHRVWQRIDSGDWGLSQTDQAMEAYAEFNIEVKMLTNN
ncbi:MAG: hypothetical protein NTZ18_03665 [Candidatus Komeilibacteria bacterium]|nr:hypothetical protein [Candidatus Komeilibacteria bacterium]